LVLGFISLCHFPFVLLYVLLCDPLCLNVLFYLLLPPRQHNLKAGSCRTFRNVVIRISYYLTFMHLNNAVCSCQPQTSSLSNTFCGKKRFKNLSPVFFLNTCSCVAYCNYYIAESVFQFNITVPPAGIASKAFLMRFVSTCIICSRSSIASGLVVLLSMLIFIFPGMIRLSRL